jgi:hypothetical protein
MPTTAVVLVTSGEGEHDSGATNPIKTGATQVRRVACSTFVELAPRMGIRTDDAIRQFVDLR